MIRVAFDGDDLRGNILGVVTDGVDNDAPAQGIVGGCRAGFVGAGDLEDAELGGGRRSNPKMATVAPPTVRSFRKSRREGFIGRTPIRECALATLLIETLAIICQVNPMQPASASMKPKAGRMRLF
jgi:hypothetical protein